MKCLLIALLLLSFNAQAELSATQQVGAFTGMYTKIFTYYGEDHLLCYVEDPYDVHGVCYPVILQSKDFKLCDHLIDNPECEDGIVTIELE